MCVCECVAPHFIWCLFFWVCSFLGGLVIVEFVNTIYCYVCFVWPSFFSSNQTILRIYFFSFFHSWVRVDAVVCVCVCLCLRERVRMQQLFIFHSRKMNTGKNIGQLRELWLSTLLAIVSTSTVYSILHMPTSKKKKRTKKHRRNKVRPQDSAHSQPNREKRVAETEMIK